MTVEAVSVGYGALSMTSWGFGDFMAKRLVGPLGYYRVLLYTQLVGLAPLLLLAAVFTPPLPSSPGAVALTIGTGACSVSSLFFFYKALSVGKASIVTPVASASAIIAMTLSVAILGETLNIMQVMCLALVVTGILFLSVVRSTFGRLHEKGLLYALCCMMAAGLNSILIKFLSYDIGEMGTLFFNRVLTTVILLAVFQLYRNKFTRGTGGMISLKVIVATGLIEFVGYFAYIVGVSVGIVSIVAPVSSASPAVTILLAQAFLKEGLLQIQKLGILFVIFGILLLSIA